MRASMSYDVDFSDVAVDHDALLGMPDDYFAEPWFSAGCIRFGAVQLGGAEEQFDFALRAARAIGAVHEIAAHGRAVISSDGAGRRGERVSGPERHIL